MKKARFCSIFFVMLILIFKVSAREYIDIKVNTHSSRHKSIVFFIRKNGEKEGFWSCSLMKYAEFSKSINDFLKKINGLTVASESLMYDSLKSACIEHREIVNAEYQINPEVDNDVLANRSFRKIIKILQELSKCKFNLNLLNKIMVQ